MPDMQEIQLLRMIGIVKKAGSLIVGYPQIYEYIKKGKNTAREEFLVIEAQDTSDNTHKKICNKCEFYNIATVRINSTCIELGAALGKSAVSCVAVKGKDMCCAVLSKLPKND